MFTDKIVVITGATSGIGKATACLFAKKGARLVLIGKNSERGRKVLSEINEYGGECEYVKCDVADIESVNTAADIIKAKYNRVDVLFNNAGIMLDSKEIERISEDEWKKTFSVNVDGIFYITRALKDLIINAEGCIVNNASIAGMHSYVVGRSYAYSASKAAVIQFSRQMAKNYAVNGVRVNCICPGIIDTPILGDRDRQLYAERIPLGYVGKPEDVANVVVFLASEQARYITGVVLPIDGGVQL